VPYTLVDPKNIGGAYVRRTFTRGGQRVMRGDKLTREDVLSIPAANRQALIEKHFIDIYPPPPDSVGGERFIVRTNGKTFDVIEGRKIAEGLTREAADAVVAGKSPETTEH
jgi:hypothetical protein